MDNMTIFDYLDSLSRPAGPELSKGTVIYKLILDVIESGVIDHMWELSDKYGYSAIKPSGCYITFWTPDIGDTVFTDKNKAYAKAYNLKDTYKVIRVKDMDIVKEINFNSDTRPETVKLLKGNMVYYDRWPCYPFLEIFNNEEKAEKRYKECIKEIVNNTKKIVKTETEENVPMQDMYLARNGIWSSYDYVNFNIPVLAND